MKKMGWIAEKNKKQKTVNAVNIAAIEEAYTKEAAGRLFIIYVI